MPISAQPFPLVECLASCMAVSVYQGNAEQATSRFTEAQSLRGQYDLHSAQNLGVCGNRQETLEHN